MATNSAPIQVILTGDSTKLKESFKDAADSIRKELKLITADTTAMNASMQASFRNLQVAVGSLHDPLDDIRESTKKTAKEVKDGFGAMNNLLQESNGRMEQMVKNLVNITNQKQAINKVQKEGKEDDKFSVENLVKTVGLLKLINEGWNFILTSVKDVVKDAYQYVNAVEKISSLNKEQASVIGPRLLQLSNQSGISINEIAKSVQEASGRGLTLTQHFETFRNAAALSDRTLKSFRESVNDLTALSDSFGISAGKAFAILNATNLANVSEPMGKLSKDAKEAGFNFGELAVAIEYVQKKIGISGEVLEDKSRQFFDGMQGIDDTSKRNVKNLLMRFTELDEATIRMIERQLGLKQGDVIFRAIGEGMDVAKNKAKELNATADRTNEVLIQGTTSVTKEFTKLWNDATVTVGGLFDALGISSEGWLTDLLRVIRGTSGAIEAAAAEAAKRVGATSKSVLQAQMNVLEQESFALNKYIRDNQDFNEFWVGKFKEPSEGYHLKKLQALQEQMSKIHGEIVKIDEAAAKASLNTGSSFWQLSTQFKDKGANKNILSANQDPVDNQKLQDARQKVELEAQATEKQSGKIAGMQKEIELLKQLQSIELKNADVRQNSAGQEKAAEDARRRWRALAIDIGKLEEQITAEIEKQGKTSSRVLAKTASERDKYIKETYDEERNSIIELYNEKMITGKEELELLDDTLVLLKGHTNEVQLVQAERTKNSGIYKRDLNEQQRNLEQIFMSELKLNQVMGERALKFERIALIKQKNGEDLDLQEELSFMQKEMDLINETLSDPKKSPDVIMDSAKAKIISINQAIMAANQEADFERVKLLEQQKVEVTALADHEITAKMKVAEIDAAMRLKQRQDWEKTHLTMKEIADTFESHLKTGMGAAIDNLIKGTGSLKDVWKDFYQGLAADLAKQGVMTALSWILGGGTGSAGTVFSAGKSILKFLGFSQGSSIGGVPGYAVGTSMGGTDTVPAMLSPGEIVLDRNASDVFRGMASNGSMGGNITVIVQSYPSLLGSREELIRLDAALNNPTVRTAIDRRKL